MDNILAKIKEICQIFEIKPSRSKGQNFLVNEKVYDDIVAAAEISPEDTVLEVGPGLGFLTAKLAAKAKQVVAVELDDRLASYLKTGIAAEGIKNVIVVNDDILRADLRPYLNGPYKVVANLPYNITSIFLRQFLGAANKPESLVLMLQKEVAQRIVATPPDMSLLAVSVQYYAAAKIEREVKAGNFWPAPEVDSAVIRLVVDNSQDFSAEKRFFRLVRFGFSAKRKMLKNNLAAGLKISPARLENILIENGLGPKIRAEGLSLPEWRKLFAALAEFVV